MAQNSGFFDALLVEGAYDRRYSSADYCDNLATVIKTGVRYSSDNDLNITAGASGLTLTAAIGRAWVEGHFFHNDSAHTITLSTAPVGNYGRIDRVVLRLDKSVSTRSVAFAVLTGTAAATPTAPALTRSGDVYEIALADIAVAAGATSIASANITDQRANGTVCGWASSVTPAIMSMLKQYIWKTELETAATAVTFDIPQYDAEDVAILDVFTNGVYETLGVDYTLSGSTLTFTNQRAAGSEIKVVLYKSIDGTGLGDVSDEITVLQGQVSQLSDTTAYDYICNGSTDNVGLSTMVKTFLNGSTTDGKRMKISVYGTFGATAAAAGSGTSASPYKWFDFNPTSTTNRNVTVDFGNSSAVIVPVVANTYNTIFSGFATVDNLVLTADGTGKANCQVKGFDGAWSVRDCYAELTANSTDTTCCFTSADGQYYDCWVSYKNLGGYAAAFSNSGGKKMIVQAGRYYCYSSSSYTSSIFYNGGNANAIIEAFGVSCPQLTISGLVQSVCAQISGGYFTAVGLITPLTNTSAAGAVSNIWGTIPR